MAERDYECYLDCETPEENRRVRRPKSNDKDNKDEDISSSVNNVNKQYLMMHCFGTIIMKLSHIESLCVCVCQCLVRFLCVYHSLFLYPSRYLSDCLFPSLLNNNKYNNVLRALHLGEHRTKRNGRKEKRSGGR